MVCHPAFKSKTFRDVFWILGIKIVSNVLPFEILGIINFQIETGQNPYIWSVFSTCRWLGLSVFLLWECRLMLVGLLSAPMKVQSIRCRGGWGGGAVDETFITGEREEVICIIYAVFSTIISDIRDRFPPRSSLLFSLSPFFSYLINAEINVFQICILFNFISAWPFFFFLFFLNCVPFREAVLLFLKSLNTFPAWSTESGQWGTHERPSSYGSLWGRFYLATAQMTSPF